MANLPLFESEEGKEILKLKKQLANAKNQNQQLLTYLEDAHAHIGHLASHLAGRIGDTARFEMAKRADEWREYCEKLREGQE